MFRNRKFYKAINIEIKNKNLFVIVSGTVSRLFEIVVPYMNLNFHVISYSVLIQMAR
mgnify:CR=1 FL=1